MSKELIDKGRFANLVEIIREFRQKMNEINYFLKLPSATEDVDVVRFAVLTLLNLLNDYFQREDTLIDAWLLGKVTTAKDKRGKTVNIEKTIDFYEFLVKEMQQ